MTPARRTGRVRLAAILALLTLSYFSRLTSAQSTGGADHANPSTHATAPRATLQVGNATRAGGSDNAREIAIPLHFTAGSGESVGRIRAEVTVPEGPWKFQKVVLPKNAWWKVSTRERQEEARPSPENARREEDQGEIARRGSSRVDDEDAPKESPSDGAARPATANAAAPRDQTASPMPHPAARQTVLELTFNAGSRLLPNGLIGTLSFSLRDPKAQPPAALLVRKLETYTTEAEAVSEPAPLPLPEEIPIPTPVQACFFFTH